MQNSNLHSCLISSLLLEEFMTQSESWAGGLGCAEIDDIIVVGSHCVLAGGFEITIWQPSWNWDGLGPCK